MFGSRNGTCRLCDGAAPVRSGVGARWRKVSGTKMCGSPSNWGLAASACLEVSQ
jgi:hypothetical protein